MKPNPFWELNHLTIPVCIFPLKGETPDWRARTMRERPIDVLDVGCGWCTRSAESRAIRPKLDVLYIVAQALNCKESSPLSILPAQLSCCSIWTACSLWPLPRPCARLWQAGESICATRHCGRVSVLVS